MLNMIQRTIESVLFGVCEEYVTTYNVWNRVYFFGSGNPEGRRVPMNLSIIHRASLKLRAVSVITYILIVVNAVEILTI